MLSVRIVDDGFIHPGTSGPEWTNDGRYRLLFVPWVNSPLQYFRVSLSEAARVQREVLVINGGFSGESAEEIESNTAALAAHFPEPLLAFFLKGDGTGEAIASCAEPTGHVDVAVAVAAVKTIAGWDETTPIIVGVGTHQFEVFMEFREQQWFARVQPSR